jgi:hypothetical protein
MNIKRSLKRLWVVGSFLWVLGLSLFFYRLDDYHGYGKWSVGDDVFIVIGIPIVFWILLYIGFWVSSGFTNDKKKDETNK